MMSVLVRGVDLHRAALRQRALGEERLQILGLRVAERPRQHAQLAGERLLLGQLAALRFFVGERRQRRDADDRAVDEYPSLLARRMMSSA